MDLTLWMDERQIDIWRVVDIKGLTPVENRGLPHAVLLVKAFPKETVMKDNAADPGIFPKMQEYTESVADLLAVDIRKCGYQALSQSESSLGVRKEFGSEKKTTPLPHKKIAVLSGIGWIGKNALFITEEYGCALSMCTVLTDMPLKEKRAIMKPSKCGDCELCINACPQKVLYGVQWEQGKSRETMLDVYHCSMCMKCLVMCKYSIQYALGH